MADQNQQKETPVKTDWISELVKPRPSNMAKIIAVWDELSTESQIEILTQLRKAKLPSPYLRGFQLDQAKKVRLKALESKSAFIRYLAARDLHLGLEKEEKNVVENKIANDPVPFVRYSDEDSFNSIFDQELKNPATFWVVEAFAAPPIAPARRGPDLLCSVRGPRRCCG